MRHGYGFTTNKPAATEQSDDGKTMKLGEICERLGFTITAAFLSSLGFEPVGHEKAAKLYRTRHFKHICAALVQHIYGVSE